jgi:hypothetical protein
MGNNCFSTAKTFSELRPTSPANPQGFNTKNKHFNPFKAPGKHISYPIKY